MRLGGEVGREGGSAGGCVWWGYTSERVQVGRGKYRKDSLFFFLFLFLFYFFFLFFYFFKIIIRVFTFSVGGETDGRA